jgi:hypothetical protein
LASFRNLGPSPIGFISQPLSESQLASFRNLLGRLASFGAAAAGKSARLRNRIARDIRRGPLTAACAMLPFNQR